MLRTVLMAGALLLNLSGVRADPLQVLHRFSAGGVPTGRLVMDSSGALYGANWTGGAPNLGEIFRLAPPAAGSTHWTYSVLHVFKGVPDGAYPNGGLTMDSNGDLYGTTSEGGILQRRCYSDGCGIAFRLSPPDQPGKDWSESVLYRFDSRTGTTPYSGLLSDGAGGFYGTAAFGGATRQGTVFRLAPPIAGETAWSVKPIHSFGAANDGFSPTSGLVADKSGALYGTINGNNPGNGLVYKLSPPTAGSTEWTIAVLYRPPSENAINGDLLLDASGALFGTAAIDHVSSRPMYSGMVFKLSPPSVAGEGWTVAVLHRFTKLEYMDYGVTEDASGNLFGSAYAGAKSSHGLDGGGIFELSPPSTSTKWTYRRLHVFSETRPNGPQRPGGPLLLSGAEVLYGGTLYSNGYKRGGTIYQFNVIQQ